MSRRRASRPADSFIGNLASSVRVTVGETPSGGRGAQAPARWGRPSQDARPFLEVLMDGAAVDGDRLVTLGLGSSRRSSASQDQRHRRCASASPHRAGATGRVPPARPPRRGDTAVGGELEPAALRPVEVRGSASCSPSRSAPAPDSRAHPANTPKGPRRRATPPSSDQSSAPMKRLRSQPTTPTMMAPQKAAQNPATWKGRSISVAILLVSRSSRAFTTSPMSPSVST